MKVIENYKAFQSECDLFGYSFTKIEFVIEFIKMYFFEGVRWVD